MQSSTDWSREMSVCLDWLFSDAACLWCGCIWSASRAVGFFSLCNTHCCLIVTKSNSLLLALCQSEQPHSLCAGGIKPICRRDELEGGVAVKVYLLCSCPQSCLLGLLCASLASREVDGTICDPKCKQKLGPTTPKFKTRQINWEDITRTILPSSVICLFTFEM